MTDFWRMLVGPTPGERVNSEMGDWICGQPTEPTRPPSEIAVKLAGIIERSGERWAFEDDQGHAHSYDLGVTVALDGAVVWQGSRDEHVHYASGELLRSQRGSADAICIRDALKSRRVRHSQELIEKKRRQEEEAQAARDKRATDAIEALARGECLPDPFARRNADRYASILGGGLTNARGAPSYLNPYI